MKLVKCENLYMDIEHAGKSYANPFICVITENGCTTMTNCKYNWDERVCPMKEKLNEQYES